MPQERKPGEPELTDAVRDEVVEALLHPDRAEHDELGRTRQPGSGDAKAGGGSAGTSPREQAAAPIDIEHVDE